MLATFKQAVLDVFQLTNFLGCRGTPAGRALFNLFSDDINGRQTGDKFSARNKAVLEAKIAVGWRPSLPGASYAHNHYFETPCDWLMLLNIVFLSSFQLQANL